MERDIVARRAVPARRRQCQDSTFVKQRDGHSVDLRVHHVGIRVAAQAPGHTLIELPELLLVVGVVHRQHGDRMGDVLEAVDRRFTHALCR